MAIRVPLRPGARFSAPPSQALAWIAIAGLAVAATVGAIMLAGTKTGLALALLAVLGPLAAYGAFRAPMIFPFGIFILLVPFDNVLAFSSFGTITKAIAIAAGAALAFYLLRTRKFMTPDRALAWWIVFYVWGLTTLTWAIDPMYGMAHVMTITELLALYIAVSLMPTTPRTLDAIITAVILSGAIAGLYGAYLFRHGMGVSTNGRLFIQTDDSVVDPNKFAAALILPFALCLSRIIEAKSLLKALLYGLGVVAITGGLAVAGSRGGILAVGAVFIYTLIRSRKRLALAAMGLGGVAIALGFYGNVLARFSNAASTGGAGRTAIWQVGIASFLAHPIFGSGFSNFELAYDQAFLTVSQTYYTRWHRAPHDILIQIGVECGIIGIALLLTMWWAHFRALRVVPRESPLFAARTAVEGTVIGLFIASLFLDSLTTKYLWLAFMMVMLVRNAELTARQKLQGRPLS